MMEALFAKAIQGRTFLMMALCGACLALGVQLSGYLHGVKRPLGLAADLLLALGLILALGEILLRSGEGLRLYGLLGLVIGGTLYLWGIAPGVRWMAGKLHFVHQRPHPPLAKASGPPSPLAGKVLGGASADARSHVQT